LEGAELWDSSAGARRDRGSSSVDAGLAIGSPTGCDGPLHYCFDLVAFLPLIIIYY